MTTKIDLRKLGPGEPELCLRIRQAIKEYEDGAMFYCQLVQQIHLLVYGASQHIDFINSRTAYQKVVDGPYKKESL